MVYRVLGYCDTTLYNDLQIGIVDWIFQASDLAEVLGQWHWHMPGHPSPEKHIDAHFKPVINNLKVSFIVINLYEVKIKLANRQNKSNFRQRFIQSFILLYSLPPLTTSREFFIHNTGHNLGIYRSSIIPSNRPRKPRPVHGFVIVANEYIHEK